MAKQIFGRRYILINHVLESMSIYLLYALTPPKVVVRKLHQMFAKFFWGSGSADKRKHWAAWDNICYRKDEGGLGFRYLFDISTGLNAKLW